MSTQSHSLPFVTLDVFTSTPFEGNPLAVVFLPFPSEFSPTQTQLQAIASEYNLSETVFFEKRTPNDLENGVQRARIFTTTREIPFAGHPTIGATSWCLVHDPGLAESTAVQKLVLKAGEIPISLSPASSSAPENRRHVRADIPHNMRLHDRRVPAADLLAAHPTVSPFLSTHQRDEGLPVVSIVKGMTAVLVELPSLEALAAARLGSANAGLSMKDHESGGYLDEGWGFDAYMQVYFYVRDVKDDKSGESQEVIRTRMMVRGIEDPATGSAASALTTYLGVSEFAEKGPEREWMIVQGVEMGRRSEIGVKLAVKKDGKGIERVQLSGCAVVICEGKIKA